MDQSVSKVAKRLTLHAEAVCLELLSGGKKEGNVWKCGDVSGKAGGSMAVNLSGQYIGVWQDFATGQKGDLLKLYEVQKGCTTVQAADWARAFMREPAWQPNGEHKAKPQEWDPWTRGYWKIEALDLRMLPTAVHTYRYPGDVPPDYVLRYDFETLDENGVAIRDKETIPWRLPLPDHKTSAGRTLPPGAYVPRGWKKGEDRPIYGLDLLCADPKAKVLVVEGEKTCDAARKLFPDLVVITWQGGCKGCRFVDWKALKNHKGPIAIWPDNDKTGKEAALYIKQLHPRANVVRIPDGLKDGWDLADPIPKDEAGLPAFDPRGIIDRALDPPPPKDKVAEVSDTALPDDSDAQRATLFVSRFQTVLRYVPEWSRWIVFEGAPPRWCSRDDGGLVRSARILSAELYTKSMETFDVASAKNALKFAEASKVRSAAYFAQADRRIIIRPGDLDCDPHLVGAPNGYIDLRTGLLHPHDTDHLITRFVACPYDPTADCPVWLAFLERIMPDIAVRTYLQKLAGYSITGLTSEHHFVFLYGGGANGKSTFLEALYALCRDYSLKAPDRLIHCDDRGATPPDVIAAIDGVRFLVGSETTQGVRLNEGTVKDLTGGDTLTGARKYEHSYSFKPVAKLWCFGNHKPAVRGTDDGIWRRMRLIRFPVQIPQSEWDLDLPSKLLAELPGILAWVVDGALAYFRDGLSIPPAVAAATQEYREDEDTLGEFIASNVVESPGANLPHKDVFKAYRKWAEESGIRSPLTNRSLANSLRDRGWSQKRTMAARFWAGFSLAPESGSLPL